MNEQPPKSPPQQSIHVSLEELVSVVVQQVLEYHQHIWQPVAVQEPKRQSRAMHPRLAPPDLDVTYVLLKCDCGEPRSFTLDGTWTLEQLKTEVPIGSNTARSEGSHHPEIDNQPSGEYPPAG